MEQKSKQMSLMLIIALISFPQISETIYTPSLPNVANDLVAQVNVVEETLSIYFIGFALGVICWGALSDLFGRRPIMLAGLIIYLAGTIACGMSTSIEVLLITRFIQAIGASVGSVITMTMMRDLYDGKQRSKLFSIISGALAFSPALGPLIGGYLSDQLSWRSNFWFLAIFGLFLIFWVIKALPETIPKNFPRPQYSKIISIFRRLVSSKNFWGHVFLIGGTNGIIFGFYAEAPFIFIDQLQLSSSYYGLFGILIASSLLASAKASHKLNHFKKPEIIISYGSLITLFGSLTFLLLTKAGFLALNPLSLSLVSISLFTSFFGIGLIIPNSLSIALKDYQDTIGSAGSIFGGLYYLIISFLTWIISMMHDGTLVRLPIFMTAIGIFLYLNQRILLKTVKCEVFN